MIEAARSEAAFGGTRCERIEWHIAIRHGFWTLLEQGESGHADGQIELVRNFRRRHSGDDREVPRSLLAMLLGALEDAEPRSDPVISDAGAQI